MDKGRLGAFMDAILAIIMTILVLELEKPTEATWEALWELRSSFFAYAVSFFGLAAMWVKLHRQWESISRIDGKIIWCSIVLMFFSSLFPYVTSLVSTNFESRFAQVLYCVTIILVTLTHLILTKLLVVANDDIPNIREAMRLDSRRMCVSLSIYVLALILGAFIYSQIAIFGILTAIILSSIPLFGLRKKQVAK